VHVELLFFFSQKTCPKIIIPCYPRRAPALPFKMHPSHSPAQTQHRQAAGCGWRLRACGEGRAWAARGRTGVRGNAAGRGRNLSCSLQTMSAFVLLETHGATQEPSRGMWKGVSLPRQLGLLKLPAGRAWGFTQILWVNISLL